MEVENGESTDCSAMQRHAVLRGEMQSRAVLRSAELCDAGSNPLEGQGGEAGGGGGVERGWGLEGLKGEGGGGGVGGGPRTQKIKRMICKVVEC